MARIEIWFAIIANYYRNSVGVFVILMLIFTGWPYSIYSQRLANVDLSVQMYDSVLYRIANDSSKAEYFSFIGFTKNGNQAFFVLPDASIRHSDFADSLGIKIEKANEICQQIINNGKAIVFELSAIRVIFEGNLYFEIGVKMIGYHKIRGKCTEKIIEVPIFAESKDYGFSFEVVDIGGIPRVRRLN